MLKRLVGKGLELIILKFCFCAFFNCFVKDIVKWNRYFVYYECLPVHHQYIHEKYDGNQYKWCHSLKLCQQFYHLCFCTISAYVNMVKKVNEFLALLWKQF